jgi:hypothetical protein
MSQLFQKLLASQEGFRSMVLVKTDFMDVEAHLKEGARVPCFCCSP